MIARGSAAAILLLASAARGEILDRWVQFGPDDDMFVRSIGDASENSCPALSIDGRPVAMAHRFTPTAPAPGAAGTVADRSFPVVMCEAALPLGDYSQKMATVGGVALKLPVAEPQRILVVGDTGCRILGGAIQACDDPVQFPLEFLGNYAASFKPDLIVHTGDFYYREMACPAGNAGCAKSPAGENWASWQADWFAPARALMQAAPLALARGNHESCDRGATGWFHLLDVHPYSDAAADCGPRTGHSTYRAASPKNPEPMPRDPNDVTPAYVIQAGPLALIMFDASYANDVVVQPKLIADYRADIESALTKLRGKPAFFVSHKPIYGLNTSTSSPAPGAAGKYAFVGGGNVTEQALFGGHVPDAISLFVSGHTHNFEVVDFSDPGFAPQLVIGNSGTLLDELQVDTTKLASNDPQFSAAAGASGEGTASDPEKTVFATARIEQAVDRSEFGFAVLDLLADKSGYVATIYSLTAARVGRCTIVLRPRAMTCSPF